MEDWQNSSLEEKVDLDNLVLFSPDSYPIAEISELRSGIKEEQSEEDKNSRRMLASGYKLHASGKYCYNFDSS